MKSFVPLEFLDINHFKELPNWVLYNNTPTTITLRLKVSDGYGERRYIPQAGAVVKLEFRRIRTSGLAEEPVSQDFNVTGTLNGDDRSIVSFNLTQEMTNKIISGTVNMILTENNIDYKISKNYAVKKISTGSGC